MLNFPVSATLVSGLYSVELVVCYHCCHHLGCVTFTAAHLYCDPGYRAFTHHYLVVFH